MNQRYFSQTNFNVASSSMPRIHSKQEHRNQLPQLQNRKQFLSPESKTFSDTIKGQQLLETNKIEAKKTEKQFFRLVYKSQYSFRPSKLNPRFVNTHQPLIQMKLGGPAFAFRGFRQLEPNLSPKLIQRQQVNYLNESHAVNQSINGEINQILHGDKNIIKEDAEDQDDSMIS